MALVTTSEMKAYLRVDFNDDDSLIANLISASEQRVMDILRIDDIDDLEDEDMGGRIYMLCYNLRRKRKRST